MNKFFPTLCLCILLLSVHAQDSVRVFYSKQGQAVDPEFAYSFCDYIRTNDSLNPYFGSEYYMSGNLKSKSYYKHTGKKFYYTGSYIGYYENGKKESEGFHEYTSRIGASVQVGRWKYFYMDGRPLSEWAYNVRPEKKYLAAQESLINFWDTAGVQLVKKGQGYYYYSIDAHTVDSVQKVWLYTKVTEGKSDSILTGYYADGKLYCREWEEQNKKHSFSGKSYDRSGREYAYSEVITEPRYPKGTYDDIFRFVEGHFYNPSNKPHLFLSGTVRVSFVINADGSVGTIKIIKGGDKEINDRMIDAVNALPKLVPAKQRGQPTYQTYEFEVTYSY